MAAAAAPMLVLAGLQAAGAATSVSHSSSLTAVTRVTNHGDSGVVGGPCSGTDGSGCWALDKYTLTATVARADDTSYDPAKFCGTASTDTGKCYKWTGTETLSGSFTTRPGQKSPRTGATLDSAVTGELDGWMHNITFYASWKGVYADQIRVPAQLDDHGTKGSGDSTLSNWVKLFFGTSATVNITSFGNANSPYWFAFTVPFRTNPSCPNTAYRWVDSVPWQKDGAAPTAGDILAPIASNNCVSA
jgi:hypothetical protein